MKVKNLLFIILFPFLINGQVVKNYQQSANGVNVNLKEGKVPERRFDLFYSDDELNRIALKRDIPKTWPSSKVVVECEDYSITQIDLKLEEES